MKGYVRNASDGERNAHNIEDMSHLLQLMYYRTIRILFHALLLIYCFPRQSICILLQSEHAGEFPCDSILFPSNIALN